VPAATQSAQGDALAHEMRSRGRSGAFHRSGLVSWSPLSPKRIELRRGFAERLIAQAIDTEHDRIVPVP
jgi:hypothetical protein